MTITLPFELLLTQQAFAQSQYSIGTPRRLSDLKDIFADAAAVDEILKTSNPVIHDFHTVRKIETHQKLIFGMTTLYPGVIGDEYYMTKGHFHAVAQDSDEIYVVMQGSGHLLMQSRDGTPQTLEIHPGSLYYTPATWAHRTVNSGDIPLVYLSLWSWDANIDYDTIAAQGGFPQRVIRGAAGPVVVANVNFRAGG